jgi:hypothetical protein
MRRNHGIYRLIRLSMVLICVGFTWFWGVEGFIAGTLATVAAIIAGNAVRGVYCSATVHPNGIHGYNFLQKYLGKYSKGGPKSHLVFRGYGLYKLYYFLYSDESNRWSWRPYALFCVLAILLYFSPLIFGACLAVMLSIFIYVVIGLNVPTALFLGSSSLVSHRVLKKIRMISGVKWASLLRDSVSIDKPTGKPEDTIDGIELLAKTNIWSLCMDDSDDWMSVVGDFICASSIVVLWPDMNSAVKEEVYFLSRVEHLERVIVIRTDECIEDQLPVSLHKCLLNENEAMDLIALTASNPRLFKKRLWGRMSEKV